MKAANYKAPKNEKSRSPYITITKKEKKMLDDALKAAEAYQLAKAK